MGTIRTRFEDFVDAMSRMPEKRNDGMGCAYLSAYRRDGAVWFVAKFDINGMRDGVRYACLSLTHAQIAAKLSHDDDYVPCVYLRFRRRLLRAMWRRAMPPLLFVNRYGAKAA